MTSPEILGRSLAAAPDPERARVALARIGERPEARRVLEDPVALANAIPLLGLSSAITDFLVAHPDEATLFADVSPRGAAPLLDEARVDAERHGPSAGLRRFRRRATARVAARDLAGEGFDDVVREITAIAEACVQSALDALGPVGDRMAVIGMGKLGGAELNYASDVDVLFVHADPGAKAQERAWTTAAELVRLLSEPTEEGIALRVDTDLRPEGRVGALSRSLEAMLDYHRRHADTWEHQALLKARPVAGHRELGDRFVRDVLPFVFPQRLELSAIEDVRRMKVRVEEFVRARGRRDVKRGPGGIRDVEFAVQLLQLVHGRRDPTLRVQGTLQALRALTDGGYVAERDEAALADSYRFLRTLEHRLQLVRDLQTHDLPEDRQQLTVLARSMGMGSAAELREEHARHTDVVRGLHERLFYRPLLDAFAAPVPHPGRDRAATHELLAGLGFRDPSSAYATFQAVIDPAARIGKVLGSNFPVIAPALALAANPDAAILRFQRAVAPLRERAEAADRLASDPEAVGDLASLVAVSSAFADVVAHRPEVIDALGSEREGHDPEAELTRVAGRYASGTLRVPESGRALAAVADRVVADALTEARPSLPFAVIGLGKLGSEELNFASDLDLLFVYEGEGAEDFQSSERAAERVLEHVRTAGFEPDPDLRPEGRNGPLARSIASYLEYWERWALLWEFQALLKARPVAGDAALGKRFASMAEDFAYPDTLTIDATNEIRKLRFRMEKERVRPREAARFHFKLGYGGLADVQFAVELSQMRHGGEHPSVRRRHTLEALEALAEGGFIEASVARTLGQAYLFLNEVKNALEIERRIPAEAVPPAPEDQAALARRLGYEEYPRRRFMEDYRRITRRARQAMERVFYGEET